MNTLYPSTSPYFDSQIVNQEYLDVMVNRAIYSDPTDQYWQITTVYNLRPDLLASDLYNDSRLWWVFAQRNPNKLKDPLNDFVQGAWIYIPTMSALQSSLGL